MQKPKRRVTVFDFDGTLVKEDTFITFALHALGGRRFVTSLFMAFPALLAWKLHLKSNGYAKEKLFSALFAGLSKDKIESKAMTFKPIYNEKVLQKLREHQQAGDEVYIISASLDLWMKPQADALGVKLCCTNAEIDSSGKITGRFSSPNCYGDEKLRRLLQSEPNRENYILTVYGDSAGDEALFQAADTYTKV